MVLWHPPFINRKKFKWSGQEVGFWAWEEEGEEIRDGDLDG